MIVILDVKWNLIAVLICILSFLFNLLQSGTVSQFFLDIYDLDFFWRVPSKE